MRVFDNWGEPLLACFLFKYPHTSHHWVWILIQLHSRLDLNFYSCSTDLTPRPPLSLGRYSTAVKLRRYLPPFSLINFLVSLSMFCSSPKGHCWVQVGYVKTGKANWFVAVYTVKSWKEPMSANTNKLKSSNSLRHRASPKHLEANSATGSAAMRIIFSTQLQEELYQASMWRRTIVLLPSLAR